MLVKRIISKSRNGNRMEVIAKDDKSLKTLHIRRKSNVWRYFAGKDNKGNNIFEAITV